MNDLIDLELLIHSNTPIIYIETNEEKRVSEIVGRLGLRLGKEIHHWNITDGLSSGDRTAKSTTPESALLAIADRTQAGVFLFFDLHPWLDNPIVIRLLRKIALNYSNVAHTLILVSPRAVIPQELKNQMALFELSLPTSEDIRQIILQESEAWGENKQKRVKTNNDVLDAVIRNLKGLDFSEVRGIVRTLIYDDGLLNEDDIGSAIRQKYKSLDASGILTFETDTSRFSDVAGLVKLKQWLSYRRKVFLADEAPPGMDMPKGLLLLGVQGGGKSLAAKSVAGAWSIPLLRLDFAALYNKYYGETERNLRESLKTSEVMSPCVLWIDEIEKGLSSDSEGGPSKRVLGTLLTWMAERNNRVFLVATANDIESLPPELLRKGRFDEIFFVDLPDHEVRMEIFKIHLEKREQPSDEIDLNRLAKVSEGFSGAEIEQAVVSSIYAAFSREEKLSDDLLVDEVKKTKPLSILMAEKINYLRNWAKERTVPAN